MPPVVVAYNYPIALVASGRGDGQGQTLPSGAAGAQLPLRRHEALSSFARATCNVHVASERGQPVNMQEWCCGSRPTPDGTHAMFECGGVGHCACTAVAPLQQRHVCAPCNRGVEDGVAEPSSALRVMLGRARLHAASMA